MRDEDGKGWFRRLTRGLSRSSTRLTEGISAIFIRRKLDETMLEELEELLITADLGVKASGDLIQALRKSRFGKEVTGEEVRALLAAEITRILDPIARPLEIDAAHKPHVVLVVGVNGSGKTTTLGKLAHYYQTGGLKVMMAAGDTFRAAAAEQLRVWGARVGCPVLYRPEGADAAALAYDAIAEARAAKTDLLLIDTAGRLHNKAQLMEELAKIVRVMQKIEPSAPHDILLVLDATVGQNAHRQVALFRDLVKVTGLVLTKLDGTAKGGVLVALADHFALPVHAIGVGETLEDLRPFEPERFAQSLLGTAADKGGF